MGQRREGPGHCHPRGHCHRIPASRRRRRRHRSSRPCCRARHGSQRDRRGPGRCPSRTCRESTSRAGRSSGPRGPTRRCEMSTLPTRTGGCRPGLEAARLSGVAAEAGDRRARDDRRGRHCVLGVPSGCVGRGGLARGARAEDHRQRPAATGRRTNLRLRDGEVREGWRHAALTITRPPGRQLLSAGLAGTFGTVPMCVGGSCCLEKGRLGRLYAGIYHRRRRPGSCRLGWREVSGRGLRQAPRRHRADSTVADGCRPGAEPGNRREQPWNLPTARKI